MGSLKDPWYTSIEGRMVVQKVHTSTVYPWPEKDSLLCSGDIYMVVQKLSFPQHAAHWRLVGRISQHRSKRSDIKTTHRNLASIRIFDRKTLSPAHKWDGNWKGCLVPQIKLMQKHKGPLALWHVRPVWFGFLIVHQCVVELPEWTSSSTVQGG